MGPMRIAMSWVMVAGLAACSDVPELDEQTASSVVDNGQHLNGQHLNGQHLNGQHLNGQHLNGQHLNGSELGSLIAYVARAGAQRDGAALDDLALDGAELVGWQDGAELRGRKLRGVELAATSDTDHALTLRIAEVVAPAEGDDAWRYRVDYRETDGSWQPICYDHATGERLGAFALAGRWDLRSGVAGGGDKIADPAVFTFACRKLGALGKCVEIGYRAWSWYAGVSLADHHQACVRLLRNDLCGDGTSYTSDGNLINLYDALGIQLDTEDWKIEAEWDAAGARCLTPHNRVSDSVTCKSSLTVAHCGRLDNFASGTLLMSEMPPR
jgi:hypothetical protein